ncbi:hypothetical protein UlMin_033105 [Ulmus minor]
MTKTNNRTRTGPEESAAGGVANPATHEEQLRSITSPLSQLITIKLEAENYILWKFQIENAILGYGLEDYIYGTDQIPPRLLEGNPNPEFIRYHRQDRLLISWILASITPSYLPQLVGCSSSRQIWTTIEQLFSSQSTAKVMFYKRQIQTLKKDPLPMRDYLMKMKGFFDMLAAADHGMSDTDQVLAILNGLGDEYESIIAIICSKEVP